MNHYEKAHDELPLTTESNFQELADYQWMLLDALEKSYIGKKVRNLNSYFEDAIWTKGVAKHLDKKLHLNNNLIDFSIITALLVRVTLFELFSTRRMEMNSSIAKLVIFKNTILKLIHNKGLLAGIRGELSLGLNHISDTDLLNMMDDILRSDPLEQVVQMQCSAIEQFIESARQLSSKVPLFEFNAHLPWRKSNLTIRAWVSSRATDLGIVFREAEGYVPLPNESADPLIKMSLSLIQDYPMEFSEIAGLIRNYKKGKHYDGPSVQELMDRYSARFNDIIEAPKLNGLRTTDSKIRKIYIWFRDIIYLARGACTNIILFTSGLRNSDVRDLRVGSCNKDNKFETLYYLRANNKKNKKIMKIPVPLQTKNALDLLEKIKFTNSEFSLDAVRFTRGTYHPEYNDGIGVISGQCSLNDMIRDFAKHFKIPFKIPGSEYEYSAHNYRTTVAGWLDAHSNLSVLLVRRLFGHSNDVMPTTYLRKNPSFVEERKAQKLKAARETSRQMALATAQGRVAGVKGDQLIRGYKLHVSKLEDDPNKSHSLTDSEIHRSFAEIIEQRILNESICGFMTPFGVRCMRNPSDSSQPPCARVFHKDKTNEIAEDILRHLNDIAPQHCIGTGCDQALVGPWSNSLLKTILWNAELLRQKHGERFTDEHFKEHAIQFIRQYAAPIEKVFNIRVHTNGTVIDGNSAGAIFS